VIERAGLLRIKGYVGKLRQPRDIGDAAGLVRDLFVRQFPNLTEEDWRAWARNTWEQKDGRLALTYDPALARISSRSAPRAAFPDLWAAFDALTRVPVLLIRGGLSDLLLEKNGGRDGWLATPISS
jgi:hypothetical protein